MVQKQRKIEVKGARLIVPYRSRETEGIELKEFNAGSATKAKALGKIVNTLGCGAYYDRTNGVFYTFLGAEGGHTTLNKLLEDL